MDQAQTPMAEFLQTSMAKIKEMVDVNTIVGDPVTTPDGVTLVPVSRVSFGFGGGGGDLVKQRSGFAGGSGAAVRIEPIGFLVIRNGIVNMLNIQPPAANTFDRIVDLIPQLMDKAEQLRDKKADAAAEG
ncbi:MAG TPA: GerW family sporulation protein [Candidatus Scatomorpha intestinigallinarum]|uniref:GerW family sporulation protein n=2 Tax=Candidatus Scatomorpha intestinigallinarum TaxID=2840923 RepID=A0A9D1DKI1_9FIRM|nr:GerW family sporulation protein [Candidatus Scatomorpha intestinigallinarum]